MDYKGEHQALLSDNGISMGLADRKTEQVWRKADGHRPLVERDEQMRP